MADHDAVAALAAEQAELAIREQAEGDRWAAAPADAEFTQEMREIARDLRYAESLPGD